MKILAFDTCFSACSVALVEVAGSELQVHASETRSMARGHAEALIPMIDRVMKQGGIELSELDRLAVTIGPGTFTGVRVGVAAARALTLATDVPSVGISSLEALAAQAIAEVGGDNPGTIIVAIDARRNQVYFQMFTVSNTLLPAAQSEAIACAPDVAANLLSEKPIMLVGSGGPLVAQFLTSEASVVATPASIDPVILAKLSAARPIATSEPLSPLYLRPPDAKPQTGFALERRP